MAYVVGGTEVCDPAEDAADVAELEGVTMTVVVEDDCGAEDLRGERRSIAVGIGHTGAGHWNEGEG